MTSSGGLFLPELGNFKSPVLRRLLLPLLAFLLCSIKLPVRTDGDEKLAEMSSAERKNK